LRFCSEAIWKEGLVKLFLEGSKEKNGLGEHEKAWGFHFSHGLTPKKIYQRIAIPMSGELKPE
jgi:hypothetical protein